MKKKTKKRPEEAHLGKEVGKLANQLVDAIKNTVSSAETKAMGKQALRGMRSTGERLMKAIQEAHGEDAKAIKNQTQRVFELGKKKTEGTSKHLKRNLVNGLHSIGEELQQLAKKLKNH